MRRVTHTLFYTNSPKSTAVERGQDPKVGVTTKTYIPNHPLVLFMDRRVQSQPGMRQSQRSVQNLL